MVQIGLPALAFLATISMVAAAPAETKAFTFSQWIEDIIANPDGDHLSPEQAVAAKLAAIESDGSLGKRAWCQAGFADANVSCSSTFSFTNN